MTHPKWWYLRVSPVALIFCIVPLLLQCSCRGKPARSTSEPSLRISSSDIGRSLVVEAGRAEVHDGGKLVDLGTPDQHKYVRDPVPHGQEDAGPGAVHHFARVAHQLRLRFYDWRGGIRSVVVRVRANSAGSSMALSVDRLSAGSRPLGTSWQDLEFPLKSPLTAGPRTALLTLNTNGDPGASALVDKVWFRTTGVRFPTVDKTGIRSFPDPRRCLVASPSRVYSFYLSVPPGATLSFSHGAEKPTLFQVTVQADGDRARTLFSTRTRGPRWGAARVDLSPFAGKVVRLDLETRGLQGQGEHQVAWAEPEIKIKAPRPLDAGPNRHARHLVHVVLDTARQDVFRTFNRKTRVRTPSLQRLAAGGVAFTNAYANANWTLPSVVGMLTGRYHWTVATGRHVKVPPQIPLLSEQLKKRGFSTAALTANAYVSRPFGLRRGWDHYKRYFQEDLRSQTPAMVDDALAWLKQQKSRGGRLYLYLHAMDPHSPYDFHKGFTAGGGGPKRISIEQVPNSGGTPRHGGEEIRRLYQGEVAHFDHHLGRLLKGLESLGLAGDTLVVFSADHGEELFDHGLLGHGTSLHEELLRVPLVIRFPGGFARGQKVHEVVELVDLPATMLDALGMPLMAGHGTSLVDRILRLPDILGEHYAVAVEAARSMRYNSYKLIEAPDGTTMLFDLWKDPREQQDLSNRAPVARRTCEVYLGEALGSPAKSRRVGGMDVGGHHATVSQPAILDPLLKRQLEALGYITAHNP